VMSTGTSTVATTATSGPGELPVMAIGESFVGEGADAAHLNTVLGRRDGPVGTAWATALATPRAGYTPFIAVVKPGLPAKPITLFINKAPIASPQHGPGGRVRITAIGIERLNFSASAPSLAAG
jgi:hypothetical protein